MHAQNVVCDEAVACLVDIVCHNEQEIETGEEGIGEGDVLMWVLVDVILTVSEVSEAFKEHGFQRRIPDHKSDLRLR